MDYYHQDCPATERHETNHSKWLHRLWWLGRRRPGVAPFIVLPTDPVISHLFRTLRCQACGTRIHIDL